MAKVTTRFLNLEGCDDVIVGQISMENNKTSSSDRATAAKVDRARQVDEILDMLQSGAMSTDDAFKKLFDLYYGSLRSFFQRRGFAPDVCLDLTQDTFVGIYTGIGAFRREAGFDTWMFKIATNVYRRQLRWLSAGKRDGDEMTIDELEIAGAKQTPPVAAGAPVDDHLLRKEEVKLLREAIARLPEQMRKCLILRVDQSLKYREIGSAMKLSVQTVKAHLFQARKRLKEELEDHFEPDLSALDEEM